MNIIYCICNFFVAKLPDLEKLSSLLDVFLGQHILLTLEKHFNPKM